MLSFLGKRKPEIELLVAEMDRKIEFRCKEALEAGQREFSATVGGQKLTLRVLVQYFQSEIYYGMLLAPIEALPFLAEIYPPPEPEPEPVENRRAIRLDRGLRVLSRELPNYQGISADISTGGLKLQSAAPLTAGSVLQMRLELDDSRLSTLDLVGEVRWCRPKDAGVYYVGIMFLEPGRREQVILREFIEALQRVEKGVIPRDYETFD